jgi:hypothetical protein
VAIDISGDGKLPQPYFGSELHTGSQNITMFLFSTVTGINLTISNGTRSGWVNDPNVGPDLQCGSNTTQGFQNAGCQEIMAQEPGSTVKHVNWAWPDCFVGNGGNQFSNGIVRGSYNISIHQMFRINDTGYHTIFNLPIEVTNTISQRTQLSQQGNRVSCVSLMNPLQNSTKQILSQYGPAYQPFLNGNTNFEGNDQGSGDDSGSAGGTVTVTAGGPVATKGPVVLGGATRGYGTSCLGILSLLFVLVLSMALF